MLSIVASCDLHSIPQTVLNVSAYKFVRLEQLPALREQLLTLARQHNLKGTILLASEGINLFVAGVPDQVRDFLTTLQSDTRFENLPIKESYSEDQPFNRMLVRLKKEIIAFGVDSVDPVDRPSKKISPAQLKQWLDEGKKVVLLDTRNTYEVELGTFKEAVDLNITNFRQFPERVLDLPQETRDQPMVMFCTGGIRCEKAGPYVEQAGFKDVYQLDGGILRYFEECGEAHYEGDCFVFDDRVAVKPDLAPSGAILCYACQHVLNSDDIASPMYQPAESCPHCYQNDDQKKRRLIKQRQSILDELAVNQPGFQPYTNCRPIFIPRRLAGQPLQACLLDLFPQMSPQYWEQEFQQSMLRRHTWSPDNSHLDDALATPEMIMNEGERVHHLEISCIEPKVNADIRIVDEDDLLVIVEKPAGLPSHASGRFNRNTLEYLINQAYRPEKIRLVHRLDANTSGVMVLVRRFSAAKLLQEQFSDGSISKRYLARVHGHPASDSLQCSAPIARHCDAGGVRTIDPDQGLAAHTEIEVLRRDPDGTSLLSVHPKSGRTNQIRCHLWHLGFPIVNDPAYLVNGQTATNITLVPDQPPMCLHALELQFTHPKTGELCKWTADLPAWARD